MTKLNADMKAGTDAATVTDVQVNHVSQTIAKPNVSGSLLSHDVSRFIEWLHIEDEWNYSVNEGLWFKYGYRSRTTQQLFDYYMKLPSNCR